MVKGAFPAGFGGLHAVQMRERTSPTTQATAAEALGLYGLMNKLATWAGKQVEDLGSSPDVQQAIKSVILGRGIGGASARARAARSAVQPGN